MIRQEVLAEIIVLSAVTASVAFTVTEATLLKPWRNWLDSKKHWLLKFFAKLFGCGYCFGHWVSFGLVANYQPRVFDSGIVYLDYFLTALLIAHLAAFQWIILCILFDLAKK